MDSSISELDRETRMALIRGEFDQLQIDRPHTVEIIAMIETLIRVAKPQLKYMPGMWPLGSFYASDPRRWIDQGNLVEPCYKDGLEDRTNAFGICALPERAVGGPEPFGYFETRDILITRDGDLVVYRVVRKSVQGRWYTTLEMVFERLRLHDLPIHWFDLVPLELPNKPDRQSLFNEVNSSQLLHAIYLALNAGLEKIVEEAAKRQQVTQLRLAELARVRNHFPS